MAQTATVTGPNRSALLLGAEYTLTWSSEGIRSVSLVAHGERTPRGTESRGRFRFAVAEGVPADGGSAAWRVPWVDSTTLFIKVKGYDAGGQQVVENERGYRFRPAVMERRTADGITLDLHRNRNQRLYVQRGGEITHVYISSSSENYRWRPAGRHILAPHDHAGVFRVLSKSRNHWSRLFDVNMPYAMRYHGGHFIHATSRNLYRNLGRPASHGCNRLTLHDARELYQMTPIGTRVEVIGPYG